MEEKILAIVNPVSANGKTARIWPKHEQYLLDKGVKLDRLYTRYPLHAIGLAREGVCQGYRRIMVVGGDGTANEVVNGLLENGELIAPDLQLIIFSQGTGCDFIRSLGLNKGVDEIYYLIQNGKIKYIDLGKVTYITNQGKEAERYFLNVADLGIGGETVKLVNESSKILGGFLTYLLGALRTILKYENKVMELEVDGRKILNRKINSVMVGNGEYFGGGIWITPGADLEDGKFKIVILGDFNKRELIVNFIKAYRGTHLSHPKVKALNGKDISIASPEKVLLEIDGETVGWLPARFSILSRKLPVLIRD